MDNDQILRTFGPVWDAAGARGFFGRGYRFHKLLGPFGPDFTGSCFVAKTSTFRPRDGNTPFNKEFETTELFPKSVSVGLRGFLGGYALNAWGLSGPGLSALMEKKRWQAMKKPFMLSFMPAPGKPVDQLSEVDAAAELCSRFLPDFSAPVAIQLNLSCPNTETDTSELVDAAARYLDMMGRLSVPIIPKVSVDMPLIAVAEIAQHPACAGLCVSNTVKYGKLPDKINWKKLFGEKSPLESMGGGGLSGAPLLPLTVDYVKRLRALGMIKHLNAGGGIMRPKDAYTLWEAGADSIFLGSMAMLRPWRVQKTIRYAHRIMKK